MGKPAFSPQWRIQCESTRRTTTCCVCGFFFFSLLAYLPDMTLRVWLILQFDLWFWRSRSWGHFDWYPTCAQNSLYVVKSYAFWTYSLLLMFINSSCSSVLFLGFNFLLCFFGPSVCVHACTCMGILCRVTGMTMYVCKWRLDNWSGKSRWNWIGKCSSLIRISVPSANDPEETSQSPSHFPPFQFPSPAF